MKTLLKILGLLLLALYFTACAGSGGGGSSDETTPTPRVVDSSPHDYHTLMARYQVGHTSNIRMLMTCDFGLSTQRVFDQLSLITDANPNAGLGCNGAKNVTIQLQNLSVNKMVFRVSVDGSLLYADVEIEGGQTFNFQRGF